MCEDWVLVSLAFIYFALLTRKGIKLTGHSLVLLLNTY